ncbi:hypothetical protein BDW72DRAFT_213981 [Aspergillus terricola var. indicus]
MFNRAFLLSINDGQEVIAKVSNLDAGVSHFTTASEVATMDLARRILNTPAPRVYAWNSQAKSHPVGAEFIIMEKAEGVLLSQAWSTMKLPQKLQVLLAMTRLQKQWLRVSFSHYSSLYYKKDVQPPAGNHFVKDGKVVRDSEFAIGPATGRDWCDAGRLKLDLRKGHYLQAVATRELKAIQSLEPPKQIALFCGPRLYRPDTEKKITALAWIQPSPDPASDLHGDNVFVDPHNPEKITGIIDWQSCHISPLFNHNPASVFLDWDGLEAETLDMAPLPSLSGLSSEGRAAAVHEYIVRNIFIAWWKLMHAKNPDLYRAHFQWLLVDLKDTWMDLPAITSDTPFPFDFSKADIERIKLNSNDAVAGTELIAEVKERMGDLWPDKGFIKHERYDACKAALHEAKGIILEQLAETDEEKA